MTACAYHHTRRSISTKVKQVMLEDKQICKTHLNWPMNKKSALVHIVIRKCPGSQMEPTDGVEIMGDADRDVIIRLSDGIEEELHVRMDMTAAMKELQAACSSKLVTRSLRSRMSAKDVCRGALSPQCMPTIGCLISTADWMAESTLKEALSPCQHISSSHTVLAQPWNAESRLLRALVLS